MRSLFSFLIVLSAFSGITKATDIRIGLFYDSQINSLVFLVIEGQYAIVADGREIAVAQKGSIVHIERYGSVLALNDTSGFYGHFSEILFKGIAGNINVFRIKPVFPPLPPKESDDYLSVCSVNDGIRMVNTLELEKYLPGTVESEGGSTAKPEYYKAQAVISRTFALKNFNRHTHEGFNLCDGVHCQAYNGKSRMNKIIYAATLQTRNEILADTAGNPVITAFHANCGGITSSASFIWNNDLPYLCPVHDPFCNKSSQRNWVKTLPAGLWETYLVSMAFENNRDSLYKPYGEIRRKYLNPATNQLLMTDIRKHFALKSSFFDISPGKDQIIFRGHGYGHGVGLCQQGAMEMARVGYTYVDILMFYFKGLQLRKFIENP